MNKRVLVIGLGISGRSAAGFLLRREANVTGVDQNQKVLTENGEVAALKQKGLKVSNPEHVDVKNFDLIVVSPGIPQTDSLYAKALASDVEVIGEVELAFRFIKNTVLGITGTNGKTTVTLLVAHVLNHSGRKASALGNSGVALTSEEAEASILSDAIIVAELSSYQLETLNSRILDAAVVLNVTPDHLDRYPDMEAYAKAKMHIEKCLKQKSDLYVEEKCFETYGKYLKTKPKTYGYHSRCDIFCDLKKLNMQGKPECDLPPQLIGKATHDVENLMAAYALCRYVGVTPEQFLAAFATFKKPSHRIEFVREFKGISYYDDSKGTNLDAVIKAVDAMNGNVILIAGGVDKGAAYTPWIASFANKVKGICAIGQAAPKMEKELSHAFPFLRFNSLQEAVEHASRMAQSGDTVLLSPGCSSFDMFRDYAHRGEEFQRIVKSL